MARLSKRELIDKVSESLRESGWTVVPLTGASTHPARLRLLRDASAETIKVYIWNVSHGGGAVRPRDEFRIQITGVETLTAEPEGRTLLLGWDDNFGVFAAYDFARHAGPVAISPSIQIGRTALEAAAEDGLAPHNRGNGEVAFAVRPDYLAIYAAQQPTLHASGSAPAELDLLERLAADPHEIGEEEITEAVAPPRRRALLKTWRLLRDRKFRRMVLAAYAHRCAFCEIQLGLLDAAHVLPVGHPDSTDEVSNGVSLCALHHRAYDLALVTFDEAFEIRVSNVRMAALAVRGLLGGEENFRGALRPSLLLPTPRLRPRRDLVRRANLLRGW